MTSGAQSKRLWKPVREQAADSFWILLIVSMSVTVLVTRVFLELSGYPQVGDKTYHIAHVLWGGLLLFIAVALPLSIVNRYALWLSAVLGGIGAGLFIDEVGKLITQSTDYFFPLAFPIIYGFIVVCVWLYWRIRRHQPRDTRTLLYHALEDLKQVLDNDLDPFEHRELVTELKQVAVETKDQEERKLAEALLAFAQSRELRLALQPNPLERFLEKMKATLAHTPPKMVLKAILIIGFGLIAANGLAKLVALIGLAQRGALHDSLQSHLVVSGKSQYLVSNPVLLAMSAAMVVGLGVLALIAAILLLIGRDKLGVRIGTLALVIALCIVNFLTFYFLQLYAMLEAAGQVFLLLVAGIYRWRFLDASKRQPQPAPVQPQAVSTASRAT
jgi:hypothetical protein